MADISHGIERIPIPCDQYGYLLRSHTTCEMKKTLVSDCLLGKRATGPSVGMLLSCRATLSTCGILWGPQSYHCLKTPTVVTLGGECLKKLKTCGPVLNLPFNTRPYKARFSRTDALRFLLNQ